MTRPGDDRPTTVLPQQTVEQPTVTTGSETRRSSTWHHRIPARIGRARTSTVVIGALFVLLGGLNFALPTDPYVTVPTQYGDVRVRSSQLDRPPPTPTPTSTPTPEEPAVPRTTEAPETSAPTPTTTAPRTTAEDEETTTSPGPSTSTTPEDPETTAPTTSAVPTSGNRSTTTGAPGTTLAPSVPTGTTDPTG